MTSGKPAGFTGLQASFAKEFMNNFTTTFAEECRSGGNLPKAAIEEHLRCMKEWLNSRPDIMTVVGYSMFQAVVSFFEDMDKALTNESTVDDFTKMSHEAIQVLVENVSILPMNFLVSGLSR